MKMNFLLVICLFFVSQNSGAQSNFAPLGAFWNYTYYGHYGNFNENVTISVVKDTLINGYETKYLRKTSKITFSLPPNPPPGPASQSAYGALQNRNDSIFYYDNINLNYEQFLFTFNMDIGDSIQIMSSPNLYAVVDTVYEITLNNTILKKWELTKYCGQTFFENASIVENIGQIDDFLRWNSDGCFIGGGTHMFSCYGSSNLQYNEPCNSLFLGIDPLSDINNSINIYPIPASDFITISCMEKINNVTIKVENILGQLILEKKIDTFQNIVIDMTSIEKGNYFLSVDSINSHSSRLIIKE